MTHEVWNNENSNNFSGKSVVPHSLVAWLGMWEHLDCESLKYLIWSWMYLAVNFSLHVSGTCVILFREETFLSRVVSRSLGGKTISKWWDKVNQNKSHKSCKFKWGGIILDCPIISSPLPLPFKDIISYMSIISSPVFPWMILWALVLNTHSVFFKDLKSSYQQRKPVTSVL